MCLDRQQVRAEATRLASGVEALGHLGTARVGELAAGAGIGQDVLGRVEERVGTARRHKQAADTVFDQLGDPRDARGDNGQT